MHLTHVGGLGSRCICLMPEIGDFMARLLLTPWIQGEQETMAACEIQSHSIQGMWRAMLGTLARDAHHQGVKHSLLVSWLFLDVLDEQTEVVTLLKPKRGMNPTHDHQVTV